MKYLIIGGSGFIGQHFMKKLNEEDIIYNLDINDGVNNTKFTEFNILYDNFDDIKLNKNEQITLIHLAAVHFDFQKNTLKPMCREQKNILGFIEKNPNIKKYVFFSSVATYGDSTNGKDENSLQKPNNDYGKSKLEAEIEILKWKTNQKNKTQVIIVRPAVVFGEYNFGNVFNLIQQIRSGLFAIIGKGLNIKSIAYAGNLVDSVMFCLEKIKDDIFIYNYSDYPQKNIFEQSKVISEIVLKKSKLIKIPLSVTKLITIPVDFLEKVFNRDLKINSMRVKKFTVSTFFNSKKLEIGALYKTLQLKRLSARPMNGLFQSMLKN